MLDSNLSLSSTARWIASLRPEQRPEAIDRLSSQFPEEKIAALLVSWDYRARDEQKPPPGSWQTWLFLGGRGAGKTRSGAEWIRQRVIQGFRRICLIAPTSADVRDVMIEGPAGLLSVCLPDDETEAAERTGRPIYEPSKRRLTWRNGAQATAYSAEEPERLRGPQHDTLWADELCAWKYPDMAWDMAMFGLRLGDNPQALVTTTPKPIKLLRELLKADTTVVTRSDTAANASNLAASFLHKIVKKYEGTRLGRQELQAEVLEDMPGALWTRSRIDDLRVLKVPEGGLRRIVVAIDPSGTHGADAANREDAADVGIVVAGLDAKKDLYVLEDLTCNLSPAGWGAVAVHAYHRWKADLILAEKNFGGAMVKHVIRTVDKKCNYKEVTASRGKWVRAEPVAALYEQKRAHHVGSLPHLEDEMCAFGPDGLAAGASPNRVDALVWAATELTLGVEAAVAEFGNYGHT